MFIDPVAFKALQNTLSDIEALTSTAAPLPEGTTPRCLELLQTAKALMTDMMKRASRVQWSRSDVSERQWQCHL